MTMTNQTSSDLVIERIINAPRELVWKAWTEPEHIMRWRGPKDFTTPVFRVDLRVGGESFGCMRSPDSKDYCGKGIYLEIVPFERLIMTDSFADKSGNIVPASYYGMSGDFPLEMRITLLLKEHDGQTKLTLRHSGIPAGEEREGARQGWNESLDKLDWYLEKEKSTMSAVSGENVPFFDFPSDREVVITRLFDAPREMVFQASTNPDLIPQWWGPESYMTRVEKMDMRPGGEWRFVQRDGAGNEYVFKGVYREVIPPEKESHTFEFEGMPGHILIETSTFEDLNGKTRLKITELFQSREDRDGMFSSGMKQGATESANRMEKLLKK